MYQDLRIVEAKHDVRVQKKTKPSLSPFATRAYRDPCQTLGQGSLWGRHDPL